MIRGLSILALCVMYLACTTQESPELTPKGVFIEAKNLWPSTKIPVCWENPGSHLDNFKNAIETHVTASFNQTVLELTGWDTCKSQSSGIRIFIFDDPDVTSVPKLKKLIDELWDLREEYKGHPRVRYMGKALDGRIAGMVFTMNFTKVTVKLEKQAAPLSASERQSLINTIALHEFGHAVGLKHEDAHPDRTCSDYKQKIYPGEMYTQYNNDSIMNRCYYYNYDFSRGAISFNSQLINSINTVYNPKQNTEDLTIWQPALMR